MDMKTAFFIVFALAGVLFFSGCSRSDSEAGLDSMRVRQDVEMVQYTEKHLLNAYARTGRGTELGRLFPTVFHGDLSSFHPGSASGFSDGDAKRRADIDADLYEVQFGEIALNLGISRQSVNTARYRLRKKLGLDKETDLDMFMTNRKG